MISLRFLAERKELVSDLSESSHPPTDTFTRQMHSVCPLLQPHCRLHVDGDAGYQPRAALPFLYPFINLPSCRPWQGVGVKLLEEKLILDCPVKRVFPYSWFDSSTAAFYLTSAPVALNATIQPVLSDEMQCSKIRDW